MKEYDIQHVFLLPELTFPIKSFQYIQRFASLVKNKCVYQRPSSSNPILISRSSLISPNNTNTTDRIDFLRMVDQQCSETINMNIIVDVLPGTTSLQQDMNDQHRKECKQFFKKSKLIKSLNTNHFSKDYCKLFLPQQFLFFSIPRSSNMSTIVTNKLKSIPLL